jgi:hypothetical protein
MTPENNGIPAWAHQERQGNPAWIRENLNAFWTAASAAFEDAGRGVIVVDTTSQPVPGAGHPFGYFPQEHVERFGDGDFNRMMAEYDPAQEFVPCAPQTPRPHQHLSQACAGSPRHLPDYVGESIPATP